MAGVGAELQIRQACVKSGAGGGGEAQQARWETSSLTGNTEMTKGHQGKGKEEKKAKEWPLASGHSGEKGEGGWQRGVCDEMHGSPIGIKVT